MVNLFINKDGDVDLEVSKFYQYVNEVEGSFDRYSFLMAIKNAFYIFKRNLPKDTIVIDMPYKNKIILQSKSLQQEFILPYSKITEIENKIKEEMGLKE